MQQEKCKRDSNNETEFIDGNNLCNVAKLNGAIITEP